MPSELAAAENHEGVTLSEAVDLGSVDSLFFSRFFFPKTYRQPSPPFHEDIWNTLEGAGNRYVSVQVFRDGAKTTLLRTFTAKRIAYGLAHTILYIGKSEDHAIRSVQWIKNQVEKNNRFAQAFSLRPGAKWTNEEIEIIHGVDEYPIRVLAIGMTGSVRGINVDDYRPDLIVLDDIIDDENGATIEQRDKVNQRVFGAIKESLIRETEDPTARMVMLQTPIDRDDASELTQNDPQWVGLKFGCFDEQGESRWPDAYPTTELKKEKESAIHRNMLSLWLREKECVVVSDEKRYFRTDWLNYWSTLPDNMMVYLAVDPSPPKDEEPEQRKKKDPDPEVVMAIGVAQQQVYILECVIVQDPNPEKTAQEFFRLKRKWNPVMAGVETVAYQSTLKWYLEQEMNKRQEHLAIQKIDDKRKKSKRIRQAYVNLASQGRLWVHSSMSEFISQFGDYPDVSHDDVLDAGAIGISLIDPSMVEVDFQGAEEEKESALTPPDEEDYLPLDNWRGAP